MKVVDEVWLVPCGLREDKIYAVSSESRLEMCKLLLKELEFDDEERSKIKIDCKELDHQKSIPTYELIEQYRRENQDKEIYFVMGSDLLPGLNQWEDGQKLISDVKFIIFQRANNLIQRNHLPLNYILLDTHFADISSTEARKRIHLNYSIP